MLKKMICTLGITCLTAFSLNTSVFANELNVKQDIGIGEESEHAGQRASLLYSNASSSNKSLFLEKVKESELTRDEVNVCVYDNFKLEYKHDDYSGVYYHGDIVKGFIKKYMFKDDAIKINTFDSDENNLFFYEYDEKLRDCDVLNISMTFHIENHNDFTEDEMININNMLIKNLNNFLTASNAFTVASAGNSSSDTSDQTLFSFMRKNITDSENKNNYLIVGQLEKTHTLENSFAYGDSIDIMVPNKWEVLDNYKYSGTSYASPVISATAANLYLAGFDYNEIYTLITSSSSLYQDNYSTYPLLDEEELYKKAIEQLEIKQNTKVEPESVVEDNEALIKLFNAFNKIHKKSFGLNS